MYCYHIKDDYFIAAADFLGTSDTHLMSNKDGAGYRPHFLCFEDENNPSILWAVPLSSQVEKYKSIMQKKIQRFGRCDTIVIGQFAGKDSAFLIQNIFPITNKYIDHAHTVNGNPVAIHRKLEQEVITKAKRTLNIYRRNKNILFTYADALYSMVLKELSDDLKE